MASKSNRTRVGKSLKTRVRPARRFRRSVVEMLEHRRMMAVVATDHYDYAPASTAHIFASDFQAGEAIQFQVLHNDGTPNTGNGHAPWTVVDGSAEDLDGVVNGSIHTTWYVDPDDSAGSSFELTAAGLSSGEFASTLFTDDGNDSPTNITTQPGWLDVNGANPVTTITAPAGFVITKVAIKSGNASFAVPSPNNASPGDNNTGDQHSGVIYADGTYGLGNGFTVTGIGTGVVKVTKNSGTKDISHVDYFLGAAPTGSISGQKFQDNNGDGIKNGSDGGLQGWTIQLDRDANGTVDATTVTDVNGNYSFTGLTAGTYRIREVNQVGWTQTTVNPNDVTVVSGTNSINNNFGNFQLGAIRGQKFQDNNGDGIKNGSDAGLQGWTIQLDKDANGTVDATTVTDINGNYSFTGLTAGVYRIREVNQVGWIQTTVNPNDVTVVSGTSSTGNNFGNFQLGSITGQKFQDNNGDGVKNGSDAGLQGWTIQLDKDANGTVDATTVTDVNGNYSFTGLTAGVYRIREVNQVGWIQTTVNPNDVTIVSGTFSTGNIFDLSQSTASSDFVSIAVVPVGIGNDFGNFQLGAITGQKFQDNNGDGIKNGSDAGLQGWTIQLDKDANGTVDATTVTDINGNYSFTGLTAGTYRIREVNQVGWIQTTVNPNDVSVVSGTSSTGNNFGNFQLGSITGQKFQDNNGDGIKNGSDAGLQGWTIQLDKDANGTVDATTVTDVNGNYSFTGLTAGTYRIREVNQVGWTQTTVNPNDVTVVSGTSSLNNNFGNFQLGAITGQKFQDNNGDGIKNGSDAGLQGWTIQLDKDANGTVDATTVTDINGNYSFTGLTAGTYRIREVNQVGWTQTTVNPNDVTVVSGTSSLNNNFGNFQLGSITGQKFQDNNGDGTKNGSDAGLQGWTIQLDKDANGTVDATTVTDINGNYSFTGLTAGTYRIREVNQVGWTQTTVNPNDVSLVSGTSSIGNNFGNFQLGAITGQKFQDNNGDGIKNGSDAGLQGWTIQLDKDANGTVDATTVTDVNGNYSFTGLTAGVYRIREVNQVGWIQTTVNPNDVSVVSGTSSINNNFGNFQLGAIRGMKFNDLDGDGVKEPGDVGLQGWTIQLDKDANGTVDATTVTDANGNYSFTGLTAGVYRIREVNQPGWTQTTINPADVTMVSGTNSIGNNFGNTVCQVIVIGPDKQNTATSLVRVVDKKTGQIETQFYAYEPNFKGGVRLATGDMDGDGADEIITAPGRGRAPEIRVFRQDGTELIQFRTMAYDVKFSGGVEVAVGDVNGDGKNDIVTVPTSGLTQVRVFYNNYNSGNPLADPIANVPSKQFDVFGKKFQGGADVILADVGTFSNGVTVNALTPDGKSEIVVANGPGLRSTIYVYDVTGTPTVIDTILPFDNKFKGGITLDAARINADLIPDFIVSAGNGGKSAIEIWDGRTNDAVDARLSAFTAFGDQKTKNAPVHAVAIDTTGDGIADQIVAVQGTDGASGEIRSFNTAGVLQSKLTGFKGSWNIAKLRCHESVTAEMDAFFAQLGA